MDKIKLCDYGCGRKAKHQLKNGKWCCSRSYNSCPVAKKKNSTQKKKEWKNPNSMYNSTSFREKISNTIKELHKDPNSIYNSSPYKQKQSIAAKTTIEKIKERYVIFTKEEEMRYNPDIPGEIQVHCKNHECKNSKEKGGWFTPTGVQLAERIRQLESIEGNGGSYFYCCRYCKNICPLYYLNGDPLKDTTPLPYTQQEIQTFNKFVLDRENGLCEYCGELAEHVHHIRPKKLEPFFALDPDFGVACCEKHHYKYAHRDGCSTGNLSKIVCSVESQKFLNQK